MNLNRSFSRRIGKSLSTTQKDLLENNLTKYLFNKNSLIDLKKDKQVVLEIGFGMGEHFINQASLNPDILYIGAEPYLNGVANVLKLAQEKEVKNFQLWPDDLDIILQELPDNLLCGIYILFPDPWPKRKQNKKRILNIERLSIFKQKLNDDSFLVFASDIDDYFEKSKNLLLTDKNFKLDEQDFLIPYDNYLVTKYHQKSIAEGRIARFLKFRYESVI
jgi:release factor glutamine methyltransferase